MRSPKVLSALLLGGLLLVVPLAGGAMAATPPPPPMHGHMVGATSSATDPDGSSILFFAQQGTNSLPGSGPVDNSLLWFEKTGSHCEPAADPDLADVCTSQNLRVSLFPLPADAFAMGPALTSTTVTPTSASWSTYTCSWGGDQPYSCAEDSGTTTASASWTATGPIDTQVTQYRWSYNGCRSTLLSNSGGRPATGTFTVLGQTYTAGGYISRDVGVQRFC